MFLLRGSVAALSKQATANQLVPHLTEQFRAKFHRSPTRAEIRSWQRSIPPLLYQLSDAEPGQGRGPGGVPAVGLQQESRPAPPGTAP